MTTLQRDKFEILIDEVTLSGVVEVNSFTGMYDDCHNLNYEYLTIEKEFVIQDTLFRDWWNSQKTSNKIKKDVIIKFVDDYDVKIINRKLELCEAKGWCLPSLGEKFRKTVTEKVFLKVTNEIWE